MQQVEPARAFSNRQTADQNLDFGGYQNDGGVTAFRALSNEIDWIAVKQLVSAGVVKENGHQIPDFCATAFRKGQSTKPGLNLYGSDVASSYFCQCGRIQRLRYA